MSNDDVNMEVVKNVIAELNSGYDSSGNCYGASKEVDSVYLIWPRYNTETEKMGGTIGISSSMEARGDGWSSEKTFYLTMEDCAYLGENAPDNFKKSFADIALEMKGMLVPCKAYKVGKNPDLVKNGIMKKNM